jgi:rhamnosyltransferase
LEKVKEMLPVMREFFRESVLGDFDQRDSSDVFGVGSIPRVDNTLQVPFHSPTSSTTCAVVVTYHPSEDLFDRINRVTEQVDRAVIVDNGSPTSCIEWLKAAADGRRVHLILNRRNEGVAHALNQGAKWAADQGYAWAFTLDQDTLIDEDALKSLFAVHEAFPQNEELAVIGSNYTDPRTGRPLLRPNTRRRSPWKEEKTVITSGSLLSLSAYSAIGPFREEFFIDCVDFEYCLRARSRSFRVVLACRPSMQHVIGATTMHTVLRKTTGTSNHIPTRRYYMTRNLLVLVREYLTTEPAWVLSSLSTHLKSTVAMLLFEDHKLFKLKYLVMGMMDGLFSNFKRNLTLQDPRIESPRVGQL